MTTFFVIPKFWGPVDRFWPRIILLRIVTNLRRVSGLPVQNSGTCIATVSLSLSPDWVLMLTLNESNLSDGVMTIFGSGL